MLRARLFESRLALIHDLKLTEKAWEGIFWRGAKVKILRYIGDGTKFKLWAKAKASQSVWKGSSPNKADPFALKMP